MLWCCGQRLGTHSTHNAHRPQLNTRRLLEVCHSTYTFFRSSAVCAHTSDFTLLNVEGALGASVLSELKAMRIPVEAAFLPPNIVHLNSMRVVLPQSIVRRAGTLYRVAAWEGSRSYILVTVPVPYRVYFCFAICCLTFCCSVKEMYVRSLISRGSLVIGVRRFTSLSACSPSVSCLPGSSATVCDRRGRWSARF